MESDNWEFYENNNQYVIYIDVIKFESDVGLGTRGKQCYLLDIKFQQTLDT